MLEELYGLIERVCSRLGLDRPSANELVDVAVGALGRDFFENPRRKKDPITQEETIAHPLLKGIHATPTTPEVGTGAVLELGLYLRAFAVDPAISEILSNLRNDKLYESTRFHLAIAFRLVRARCSPTLEPKTDRGKSDILFTFDGRTYVAECYRLHVDLFEHLGAFESAFARRLMATTPPGKKYRFIVHLNATLTYDGMRRMLRKGDELVSLFHSREDLQVIHLKHGPHLLGIEDITGVDPDPDFDSSGPARSLREDEADLIVCRTAVSTDNVFDMDKIRGGIRDTRVLIKRGYERTEPKNPYGILLARMGDKLKQTKIAAGNYGRLLFVEFPWGLELDNSRTVGVLKRLREDFTRRFPEVGAVALLERRPAEKHFGYRGKVLAGNEQAAVPTCLIDKLNEVEEQGLFKSSSPS